MIVLSGKWHLDVVVGLVVILMHFVCAFVGAVKECGSMALPLIGEFLTNLEVIIAE